MLGELFIKAGLVLILVWVSMRWKKKALFRIEPKDAARRDVLNKLATLLLLFLAALLFLEVTGSNVNTLLAFGGISGLALAFASQEVVSSFFGGFMIYLTRPFVVGDSIVLPEKSIEGCVEEIGWYTTKIRTLDQRPISIPNALFNKMVIINPSRMNCRQIKETIHLCCQDMKALESFIEDVRKMLESNKNIDPKMSHGAYFTSFEDDSLNVVFSAYTPETTTRGFNKIKEELLFGIIALLDKHKIKLRERMN